MNPSNIQPENLANISVDRHGEPDYPEAQSSGSSQHGIVPDGLGEVLEGTEDIDDQWNDREQNEESLALDDDVDDEDSDPYLSTERGIGEVSGDPVRLYLREIGQVRLLKAQDEHVLARSVEGARHFVELETALTEREGRPPRPWECTYSLLSQLVDASPLVAALGLDDDVDDEDSDPYLSTERGIGEVSGDPVRLYLREIGQVRLLKAQDEHVLARSVEGARHFVELETALTERKVGRPVLGNALIRCCLNWSTPVRWSQPWQAI